MKRAILCLSWALLTSLSVVAGQYFAIEAWRTRDQEQQQIIRAYSKAHDELKSRADLWEFRAKLFETRMQHRLEADQRHRARAEWEWMNGPQS